METYFAFFLGRESSFYGEKATKEFSKVENFIGIRGCSYWIFKGDSVKINFMKKIMIAAAKADVEEYKDYIKAFEDLGTEPFLSLSEEDAKEADALVLPGSRQDMNPKLWGEEDQCSNDINDALDSAQLALMDFAIEKELPVLGICRGMQFINVYFGGSLIQDLPCAEAHKRKEPECYHSVTHVQGTLMPALFGECSFVNTRHHQGVGRIGNDLQVVSFWNDGEDTVVEAIEVTGSNGKILGVQWHPEKMYLYGDKESREDGMKLLKVWLGKEEAL